MSMLTDHDLDDVLTSAGSRLSAHADRLAIGAPPRPTAHHRRATGALVAACLVLAAGTVVATTADRRAGTADGARADVGGRSGVANAPAAGVAVDARPAFVDPAAIEITITRTETHEPDADTERFTASPVGGDLTLVRGPRAATMASGASMATITVDGDSHVQTCWLPSGASSVCGPSAVKFGSGFTRRDAGGQMIFTGVPDGVVQLRSASATFWTRPVEGVVLFPYTDEIVGDARIEAWTADGTLLWTELRYDGEEGALRVDNTDLTGAADLVTVLNEPPR